MEVDILVERTQGTAATGGRGQARQQLVDPMRQQLVHWMVPYSHADNLGGTHGEQDRPSNPGYQYGEIKPQSL